MQNTVRSFSQFKNALLNDPKLQAEFKTNPQEAIKNIKTEHWFNDKLIYRLVVLFLGIIVLAIVIGVIVLVAKGKIGQGYEVPDILIATASTAIGAIAGLLTPNTNSES